MKICLATYQSVLLLKGGPRTQILETQRWLQQRGADVSLFESWKNFSPGAVDLVHLFGANIGTYHLARELHKLGVPLVVTPIFYTRHSNAVVRMVSGMGRAVKSIAPGFWTDYGLVREICDWARVVLPNTGREKDLVVHGMGIDREKVSVVPNGVDERFYSADPKLFREKYGVDGFVLNVGHIGPERKNVLRLIQALEHINVPSVIIGRTEENPYARACRELAKKNPRLTLIDSLPNDSPLLASAYAACDVFCLPSLFETPGIAALEAALAGAKIVITKYGGTEDYFGGDAEYVEPTAVELIHHGIVTALNATKNDSLRTSIRDRFLWSHIADQYLAVYTRLLSHGERER
jgi:glycosyltransferase involved in cell wall biosynthesis